MDEVDGDAYTERG